MENVMKKLYQRETNSQTHETVLNIVNFLFLKELIEETLKTIERKTFYFLKR